jgi:hypothetical protein
MAWCTLRPGQGASSPPPPLVRVTGAALYGLGAGAGTPTCPVQQCVTWGNKAGMKLSTTQLSSN